MNSRKNQQNTRAVPRKRTNDRSGRLLSPKEKAQVRSMISSIADRELKYFDNAFNGVAVSSTSTIFDLSLVSQGAAANQRNGQDIEPVHFEAQITLTGADTTNVARVILFQHKPNSSLSPPLANQLLDPLSGTLSGTVDVHCAINTFFEKEYRVLADYTLVMAANSETFIIDVGKRLSSVRLPKSIGYNSVANTGEGHICILLLSDSSVPPDLAWTGQMRLRFYDV